MLCVVFYMKLFCKTGIVVMSLLLAAGILLKVFGGDVIATSSGSDRKLPIYCTTREDKKISLSFDAAWGND